MIPSSQPHRKRTDSKATWSLSLSPGERLNCHWQWLSVPRRTFDLHDELQPPMHGMGPALSIRRHWVASASQSSSVYARDWNQLLVIPAWTNCNNKQGQSCTRRYAMGGLVRFWIKCTPKPKPPKNGSWIHYIGSQLFEGPR